VSEALDRKAVSRRGALSLLGLAGALGLAVPRILLTVSEAQAMPSAFAQAEKPIPGEGGARPAASHGEKPLPGEGTGTKRRKRRRRRPQDRRPRRITPRLQEPPSESKPKFP